MSSFLLTVSLTQPTFSTGFVHHRSKADERHLQAHRVVDITNLRPSGDVIPNHLSLRRAVSDSVRSLLQETIIISSQYMSRRRFFIWWSSSIIAHIRPSTSSPAAPSLSTIPPRCFFLHAADRGLHH